MEFTGSFELTEEDQIYFDKLQQSIVETKVSQYLAQHTSPLQNEEVIRQRFYDETLRESEDTFTLTQMGYTHLMEGLKEHYCVLDADEASLVREEVTRWNTMLMDLGPYKRFLTKVLESKQSLQQAFYLSNLSMSIFYQIARDYLISQEIDKALTIFYLLANLNQNQQEFWHGLAFCYQNKKLYEEAIPTYEKAKALEPEEPIYDALIAQCHFELGSKPSCLAHIKQSEEKIKNIPEHEGVKQTLGTLRARCM